MQGIIGLISSSSDDHETKKSRSDDAMETLFCAPIQSEAAPGNMVEEMKPQKVAVRRVKDANGRYQRLCLVPDCMTRAQGKTEYCIAHGGGRRCQTPDCTKSAQGATNHCKRHGGGKRCQAPNCTRCAESRYEYCVDHGGGRRCAALNCVCLARGKAELCDFHGNRCQVENCRSIAAIGGLPNLCIMHGGGRRCIEPGCTKGTRGRTPFCVKHGGGRCKIPGCESSFQGKTKLCIFHGGGNRCPRCINTSDGRNGYVRFNGLCGRCFREVNG